jgi:hypothetical protein
MVTISDCLHRKVNLRKKINPYVISTAQRCPDKILYFLIEDFFHLPPVSRIELWISPKIFVKIWKRLNGILRGLWETDSWKKPKVENIVALSLYYIFSKPTEIWKVCKCDLILSKHRNTYSTSVLLIRLKENYVPTTRILQHTE